jgi:L-amino acid N-acyltransferase YncA
MLIRPARTEDFAAVAAITNHYIATTAIHFGYDPVTAAELEAAWQRDRERYPWLVLEDSEHVVIGYAKGGVWRERAAYRWTAEVGLYLAHDAHGRGLGTRLYGDLLAELTRRGFRSAIGGVTLPNAASIALHRRLGFGSVGVVREAGYKFDRWHDVEFFQKKLALH